jgi:putative transposase
MLRAFQFRLKPNALQCKALELALRDNCETYNAALQERRDAWKLERKAITYRMQQNELTELRQDKAFAVIACDIQRDPLRRVDRAFKAFFRRCKAGQVPGFPRFRSANCYDSFGFSMPAIRDNSLNIPNIGRIKLRGGREVTGRAKFCTVKRDGKRWTASIVADIGTAPEKRAVSHAVGIDVGLTTLVTLSDGTEIENPRWTKRYENRIACANRVLARKQKRSKNRIKAKEALRRAHQRAVSARTNYLHHISKWLVAHYDLIAYEDLTISNMARSKLAKGILDAAWGQLIGQIKYKAESAGAWAVPIRPHGTTIRCSYCGKDVPKTLAERTHDCPHCGLSLGRDHNAALNTLALGMSAAGVNLQNLYRIQVRESCI